MGRLGAESMAGVLLMSSAAVGKMLFLCHVVLVLILPEGSVLNSLCLRWEGSGTIFPACLRVLLMMIFVSHFFRHQASQ